MDNNRHTKELIEQEKRERREKQRFSDIERNTNKVYEENLSEHQEIVNEMIGDTSE